MTKKEINQIKSDVKKKKKELEIFKRTNQDQIPKKDKQKKLKVKKETKFNVRNLKKKNNVVDICTIIEKCNIEEISKYLIKKGNQRKFPDITLRE